MNPNLKVVHRLIIEKSYDDPAFEDTELRVIEMREINDMYDYFPDFGI